MSRNQLIIVGAALLLIVAGIAAYFTFFSGNEGGGTVTASAEGAGFTILPSDRTLGNPHAKVTVIEYAAPTCPHCARYNEEVIPLLKKQYVETGKVFYVLRIFPISSLDGAAEGMARCLGDNYFPFIDLLFRNQKQWDQPEYPESVPDAHEGLLKMGAIGGLTRDQAEKCMADKANADRVNQVGQDASTRYGVNGTPTLVINGTPQQAGEVPWPTLKATLDLYLSKR